MFKLFVVLAIFAVAAAYNAGNMRMSMGSKFSKAMGIASLAITLAGPVNMPQVANADGAVSVSTVYRARNLYGGRITDLKEAVSKGDFAAFEDKKVINSFDLFISRSNALNSQTDKDRKAAEKNILANIYSAVKARDSSKLKSSYDDFVKVADLKSDYKPGEKGQSDSSGYAPTYGTAREFIYQR
jgi:hypothetical protein